MAFALMQGFQTNLSAFLANTATLMSLPAAFITQIQTAVTPGNFTIFSISNGLQFEIIQCTGVSGGQAVIVRAQEGTTAQTFAAGSTVRFVWTQVGILAITNGGAGVPIVVTGSNAVTVTGGPVNYNVDVPFTTLTAGAGISVTGTFPNFTITNTAPGSGVLPTIVTGSGVAVVTPILGGYNVDVSTTTLTAGLGISVTGTFPNFTIASTVTPGGTGTVTSVTAGPGISVTGVPTVTPTVSLTPTGIVAGVYGALTVNTYGQLTAIAASLISQITSATPSLVVSAPLAGVVTLTQGAASTAAFGIVKLALPTAAASNNAGDLTSAVTPAGINAVLLSLGTPTVAGAGLLVPLAPATYVNTIPSTVYTLSIASGQSVLLWAMVEVVDTMTPTNIANFAIAFFDGLSLIDGNSVIPGNTRVLMKYITGPYNAALNIKYTALGANEVLGSVYLNLIYF